MSSRNCGVSSRPFGRTAASAGSLRGHAEQLVARLHQRVVAEAGAVLQLQVEAGRVAELDDRRRREGEDHARRVICAKRAHRAAGDRLRLALAPLRSSQSLSLTKAMPAFWPLPAKLKPATVKHRLDRVLLVRPGSAARPARSPSSVRSCVAPGRQLHLREQHALVLVGQEAGRQAQEQHGHARAISARRPTQRAASARPSMPPHDAAGSRSLPRSKRG